MMKTPFVSLLLVRHRLRGFLGTALLVLLAFGVYWAHLMGDHSTRLQDAESQARQHAVQMSAHTALQVSTLVSGLEYLAHSLATKYAVDPENSFPLAVRTALQTFAAGSIL